MERALWRVGVDTSQSTQLAFVVRTGRRDALPYIHVGWFGAVALGVVTWSFARYLLGISGANREVTEGLTALLAAAMLDTSLKPNSPNSASILSLP